jgi:regulator of sigma E protease
MLPLTILISILGLGILAAAHEIGHYLVAVALKIKVYELSIFVGPSLFHWKRNGVEYHIRCIPFGAYVRFSDFEEEERDDDDPRAILNQPRWKRIMVSLAGPIMNIILGVIILSVLFSVSGFYTTKLDTIYDDTQIANTIAREGDRIISVNGQRVYSEYDLALDLSDIAETETLRVKLKSAKTGEKYEVVLTPETKPIYMLGIVHYQNDVGQWEIIDVDPKQNDGNPLIEVGDIVLTVEGVSIDDPDIGNVIANSKGEALSVSLIRDGVSMELSVKTFEAQYVSPRGMYLQQGTGIPEALREAFVFPVSMLRLTTYTISGAFEGKIEPYNVVSGPVGMVSAVSDVVELDEVETVDKVETLVLIAGAISIGLAFTNLLPLPGLDGNAIVLLVIETIRGKRISKKTEYVINVIGFIVIVSLVIFALASDIIRLRS